jgi:hypothetical protein
MRQSPKALLLYLMRDKDPWTETWKEGVIPMYVLNAG